MSYVPPPPPGFTLERRDKDRQAAPPGVPPPPPGFELETTPAVQLPPVSPSQVIDGDTLRLTNGPHVRLWGVDAPELRQPGYDRQGNAVPMGQRARTALSGLLGTSSVSMGAPVGQSYGREVAPLTAGGADAGTYMARQGQAFVEPDFVQDPDYRFKLMQAARLARQNRLGVYGTYTQLPSDYRADVKADPGYVVPRETIARFWDTPTPWGGLSADAEHEFLRMANDPSVGVDNVVKFARDSGGVVNPADVVKAREKANATKQKIGMSYVEPPKILTDLGDGATGATIRGYGSGFLAGGLDEAGAVADTMGLTAGRENVFNSDRRLADIWANNEDQNESILGYDRLAHPYATTGGDIAGGLTSAVMIPYGGGARTAPELFRVGLGYGAASGFLGTEGTVPQRLEGAAIAAPVGGVLGAGAGKALEMGAPYLAAIARKLNGRSAGEAADAAVASAGDYAAKAAPEPPSGATQAVPPPPQGYTPVEPVPGATGEPAGNIPPPPAGFTLEQPRTIGMDAEPSPSISADLRQRDYIDTSALLRPTRLDQPLSEAQLRAAADNITPGDVLPVPSNVVESAEEAAGMQAGRYAPAKPVDERSELTRQTIRNWRGDDVPKVGPVDLVGFVRTQGGLQDQGGELSHMGMTNAARRGLDFVGQEARFGPLVNSADGLTLDDAADAAWRAGYFPDQAERPTTSEFLDALRGTYEGTSRHFLPEDFAQIDRHQAAQSQRLDLEQQLQGGPVFQDRSAPAAEPPPLPPVSAYEEWGSNAPDYAGNVNLGKLDTPQDISRALVQTERRTGFDAATRGRVTQAETERLASELGMTPDDLLSRRKGQAWNAEEALAARQILAKSGNELVNAARRVSSLDDPGAEVLADFRQKWLRHVAIQEQVSGATAEAGRALAQFRIMADSRAVRGDVLSSIVRGGGGKNNLKNAADALIDLVENEPGKFNEASRDLAKPTWRNRVAEYYVNSLLSGPQTHVVNMASNTLTSLAQIPEYATAAAIGGMRRLASRGAVDRVTGSEVGARAFGLIQGTKEGLALFTRALRSGEASDFASKVEGEQYKAIPGKLGEAIRLPTRFLTAEDELFKGIARRMELNAQAVRIADKEGLKGAAAYSRITDLVANPTEDMLAHALDYGRYLTFQRPLGPWASKLSGLTDTSTTPGLVAKFFLPFVRTPTNLLKFAAERSPAAPLLKEWRADFLAGGARRDLAMARAALGTGVGLTAYTLAKQGKITGSPPSDPAQRRLLYADGWQPYSVKLGGTYYSYKRLDPFSTTLGVAADMATIPQGLSEKQQQDKTTLLIASIMGNLADKTWLSGVSDIVSALEEPDRYADNLEQRLVASFLVPAAVSHAARASDPTQRTVKTVGDAVQARIPGMSQKLLPRRDVWGQPVINQGGAGPDFISPVWVSKQLSDPVNSELLKLDYSPGYPSKTVAGRELSAGEFDRYQALAGAEAHKRLASVVTSPDWKALDPDRRSEIAKQVVEEARADVRGSLFGNQPPPPAPPPGYKVDGRTPAAPSSAASDIPPPPPGFTREGEAGGLNVYADIEHAIPRVRITSGYRTPAYQAAMKARGYRPANNSAHLTGSAMDFVPPPGMTIPQLGARIVALYPRARLLNEGDHLHGTFPGYYGAPVLGGAASAGIRNPNAGMPAPPPGFTLVR